MAELLVVRAGTTDDDVQGRIRGNLDLPLTAAGRDASAAVADRRSPRRSSAPLPGHAPAAAVGAVPRGWFGLSFP